MKRDTSDKAREATASHCAGCEWRDNPSKAAVCKDCPRKPYPAQPGPNTAAADALIAIFKKQGVECVDVTPKPLRVVLGVDPGFLTGLALIDYDAHKCIWTATVSGTDALNTISGNLAGAGSSIIGAAVQTLFFPGKTPRWNKSPISLAKNAALAGRIAGFLEGRGVKVQMVPPTRGKGMKMNARIWAADFKYSRRTSEHSRDAACIAAMWREGR